MVDQKAAPSVLGDRPPQMDLQLRVERVRGMYAADAHQAGDLTCGGVPARADLRDEKLQLTLELVGDRIAALRQRHARCRLRQQSRTRRGEQWQPGDDAADEHTTT